MTWLEEPLGHEVYLHDRAGKPPLAVTWLFADGELLQEDSVVDTEVASSFLSWTVDGVARLWTRCDDATLIVGAPGVNTRVYPKGHWPSAELLRRPAEEMSPAEARELRGPGRGHVGGGR